MPLSSESLPAPFARAAKEGTPCPGSACGDSSLPGTSVNWAVGSGSFIRMTSAPSMADAAAADVAEVTVRAMRGRTEEAAEAVLSIMRRAATAGRPAWGGEGEWGEGMGVESGVKRGEGDITKVTEGKITD